MIINNHKYIYKTVAEKYKLNQELVEKIGSFTWNDLNRRISNFENREIYVLKLGTWKFRKIKSERYIKDSKRYITTLDTRKGMWDGIPFSEETKVQIVNKIEEKIAKMNILLKEWEDIIEERKQFKLGLNNRNIQE